MNKRTKITIYVSASVAVLSLIAILLKRNSNKKAIDKIQNIIDTGKDETGTYIDLKDSEAFNPKFWQKFIGQKVVQPAYPEKSAKVLHDAINQTNSDEDTIFDVLRKQNSKFAISKISYEYEKLYKKSLFSDLLKIDLGTYTGVQLWGTKSDMQIIQEIINSKPDIVKG